MIGDDSAIAWLRNVIQRVVAPLRGTTTPAS
jgi:hypothetical protein